MRLRRKPTTTQPPVGNALQDFGNETRGHRWQSPRRQKVAASIAIVTLFPAGIVGGHLLNRWIEGDPDAKAREQAKEHLLEKEHDKFKGFSCSIGQIAMSPITDMSSGARVQVGVTVRGADHATLRAAAFDHDQQPTATPTEVSFVPPVGAGGDQLYTNTLMISPDSYNDAVVVYAFDDNGASIRCRNGVELRTHEPGSDTPIEPTPVNIGTDAENSPYPVRWPL